MRIAIFITAALAVSLLSCNSPSKSENKPGSSDQSTDTTGIRTEILAPRDYNSTYTTTGTVRAMTGKQAEITSPFEGRVLSTFVKLGQKVSAGSPVFSIHSTEYMESVKAFLQAKQEKTVAESTYHRQKDLLANGIGSQKEFQEAEAAWRIASKEYERAQATLRIYDASPSHASIDKPLIIKSPIKGEVVRNTLVQGGYLKGDAEAAVTVADLDEIWVVARVKEGNIGRISIKDCVSVKTDAYPDQVVSGEVTYIGELLDEETRSVEVYVACKNSAHRLKPGMFASVQFSHPDKNALVVPLKAIQQGDEQPFVWIKRADKGYEKRPVKVVFSDDQFARIGEGLKAGETIVVEGGVLINETK